MPRRLGQHFLKDAAWRQRILRALRVGAGETWLEIGAGHGEMTRELVPRAGRVLAIEVDPPLVETLRRLAAERPNLQVIAGDVLALDLNQVLPADGRARVYGSLPYYITSPILRRLFQFADRIESIAVVIQLEVAVRLVARPGSRDYGFLSVLAQFYSLPEIALRLPPGAFQPRPKVASALVRMRMPGARNGLGVGNEASFLEFVGRCFAHKRKTVLNNLRGAFSPSHIERALETVKLGERARAEELTLKQFAGLSAALAKED
jgi:16S rRNA (adenine1518-N6/adenine1519-N6)-dimethyltransferase